MKINMKYGFIYETTNLLNGKNYIGKHKRRQDTNDPDDSWYLGSGLHIIRAIEKYSSDNFSRKILCECSNEEELEEKERYYIDYYNAVESPTYYNIVRDANPPILSGESHPNKSGKFWRGPQGEDLTDTPEIRRARSERMKIHNPMFNPEYVARMIASNRGRVFTEEHRVQLSKSHKGIEFSAEHKRHLSESQLGHEVSEISREKISSSVKTLYTKEEWQSRRSKAVYHNICVICGVEFTSNSNRSKYCSSCRKER